MKTDIIKTNVFPASLSEAINMGKVFFESGLFTDLKSAAQAVVKIQAGAEIGVAPFAALSGIHIILGKPVIGAGVIASRIKASGKYDYKIAVLDDKTCSIDFYQGKELIGNSKFTVDDAKKAGTKNLDKFPKNMLFARAISNGAKWFTPDVFDGPVYVPEEFDEQVTEDVSAEIVKDAEKNEAVHTEPFEIPGHWYAKMEKCKSKADVIEVYKANKATIDASPELQKLLKDTQNQLNGEVKHHA